MIKMIDVEAFKKWLMDNSINEREIEESKQIGIWLDVFPHVESSQELLKDGTLVVKTDFDMSKFDRVNVIQNGTHYGDLFYQDDDTRRNGEWIKDNNAITYDGKPHPVRGCEFCDSYFADNGEPWNYCPVCGAKLK